MTWDPTPKADGHYWSWSRFDKFTRCGFAYGLNYDVGLEPLVPRFHMEGGRIAHLAAARAFHRALGVNMPNLERPQDVEACKKLDRCIADRMTTEPHAREYAFTKFADAGYRAARWMLAHGFEPVRSRDGSPVVEKRLVCPLDVEGYDGFVWVVDGMFDHPALGRCVVDLKFSEKSPPSVARYAVIEDGKIKIEEEHRSIPLAHGVEQDPQVDLYTEAFRRLGKTLGKSIRVDAMLKLQVRVAEPKEPAQNANGKISTKDLVTDWTTYAGACRRHGNDPDDPHYDAIRKTIEAKVWQVLVPCRSNETSRRRTWHYSEQTARLALDKNLRIARRETWAGGRCTRTARETYRCEYETHCTGVHMGGDESTFDQTLYRIRGRS